MKLMIQTEVDLREPTTERGFITWLTVQVLLDPEDHGERVEEAAGSPGRAPCIVGRGRIALLHGGTAMNLGGDLRAAAVADSDELAALHGVFFDGNAIKDEFFEGFGHDLLYVSRLEIDEAWRDRNIELAVVRRLLDVFEAACELAAVPYESQDEKDAWKQMGFYGASRRRPGLLSMTLCHPQPRVDDPEGNHRFVVLPRPPYESEGDEDEDEIPEVIHPERGSRRDRMTRLAEILRAALAADDIETARVAHEAIGRLLGGRELDA